jgi:diguanylate cyclase (GGDEF)-like protein
MFEKVFVQLVDAESGLLVPAAACGWREGEAPTEPRAVADIEPLLDPAFEQEGCFLLPPEARVPRPDESRIVYASKLNGRGPWAWNRHSLAVPLRGPDGRLAGLIWADEPQDRLLPNTGRLQALRLFANQAATALASAGQFEELRFLADHDPLTRLLNRRAFMERLEAEAARSLRHGRSFSLVLCDLDGLKELNDSNGHPAGDAALRQLADVLSQSLRRSDAAFRIGGDEFALLLVESGREEAVEVVERVALLLQSDRDGRALPLTASFGAAACPKDADTPDGLFHAADEALYAAKRSGERLRFAA